MKHERLFQLMGIAIFLIISSFTYYTVTPVNNTTNATTNITANTQGDNSIVTNVYHTSTAIATGGVISILTIFFVRSSKTEIQNKRTSAEHNR